MNQNEWKNQNYQSHEKNNADEVFETICNLHRLEENNDIDNRVLRGIKALYYSGE